VCFADTRTASFGVWALGVASGRLSFVFGFTGSAESVDNPCSSSLVTVHNGYAAVVRREATSALTAGQLAPMAFAATAALAATG
jgi:acyl transferase domain-containing protein